MLRLRWLSAALLPPVLLVAAACGGGDDDETADGGDGGGDSQATGTPLSDTEYLKTLCSGLTAYQESVLSTPDPDEIAKVVEDFAADMKAVTPPEDLQDWQAGFVKYLEDAVEEPTSLLTTAPPMPDDDVRQRLANKVPEVPECKYPTFLGEKR
ncbi:MAG: hypothetical protein IT303_06655 [Dehalococcoidia bacterium]|nr:hypothetical protein [Dehalococcoidia bacterium]